MIYKKSTMKTKLFILVNLFTLINIAFAKNLNTENVTANQMVNIAGKQRMLSQKMAKVYLFKAYGANLATLNSELNISKIIFERNLETLTINSDKLFSSVVRKSINKEKTTWNTFKSILNKPVSESNVLKILELSSQLLKDSHAVVVKIKKENIDASFATNPDLLEIIDKSGKQRMLSQRLCLYFIAKKFALKNKNKNFRNDVALYSTFNELDESLGSLLNSELNNMNVEEAVGQTMFTFENLRAQKSEFLDGTASLNLVYNTTNKLTKDFDNLTSKYAALKTNDEGVISAR